MKGVLRLPKINIMKEKIKKALSFIAKQLFFYFPFVVLYTVASEFVFSYKYGFSVKSISEIYKILFGSIGFTAILSGLSFRASSSTENREKKTIFNMAGERLFHATILFIISTVLQYTITNLVSKYSLNLITFIICTILIIPASLFFTYGLIYTSRSLILLHRILFIGWEDPLK